MANYVIEHNAAEAELEISPGETVLVILKRMPPRVSNGLSR